LQNLNSRVDKEDLQQLEHQGLDPSAIKEEIGIQDLRVDVKGQLRKFAIDQLYNQKFKKFLYYCWVQSSIICRYNLGSHKISKFYPTPKNHSLLYTPIICTKTKNQNLVWDDFEQFYALIISSQQLEIYAFQTYPSLSYFLKSWTKFKKFKFVPLVGPDNTPPTRWKLGPVLSGYQILYLLVDNYFF
jgi:hypothetical protein